MMSMTHYMALLADNQPWNLILFMAIPVILAETVAITELYLLFTRKTSGCVRTLSRVAGILGGIYFTGVFIYLFNTAVIPLTLTGGWRGIADIIAVGFYLAGIVPLAGIALIDANILLRSAKEEAKMKLHAIFVVLFLVVAHIAMIFGMISPAVFGYVDTKEMPMMQNQATSVGVCAPATISGSVDMNTRMQQNMSDPSMNMNNMHHGM